MCRYKPCTMWVLFHSIMSVVMLFFCLSMFMFVGGTYPSKRFDITWKWSMLHYVLSIFLTIYSAMLIYKEDLKINENRLCVILLGVLSVSATCLTATIWPAITKSEYRAFVQDGYRERLDVPVFVDWFQFTQGCCGVDNYKDYLQMTGTRLEIGRENIDNDPKDTDDKPEPNAEFLERVVFDIPRSCCSLKTRANKQCGKSVPYTTDVEIDEKVNNLTKGCYKILYDIIYLMEPVQTSMMFIVFRTYPVLDALLHVIGLGVHTFYYNQIFRCMHAPDDPVFYGKF